MLSLSEALPAHHRIFQFLSFVSPVRRLFLLLNKAVWNLHIKILPDGYPYGTSDGTRTHAHSSGDYRSIPWATEAYPTYLLYTILRACVNQNTYSFRIVFVLFLKISCDMCMNKFVAHIFKTVQLCQKREIYKCSHLISFGSFFSLVCGQSPWNLWVLTV